jgi:acetyl esterase/lipase
MVILFVMGQMTIAQESISTKELLDYKTATSIAYRTGANSTGTNSPIENKSQLEKCELDVYWCDCEKLVPTVVWFHGGGLTGGKREVPKRLMKQRVNVVAVDYRLVPDVTVRDCIDDAAAAVAWTVNNIQQYNGDASQVFVSGHSAGGYLTSMIGLDKAILQRHSVDADSIAGLIPFSGHTITHFTERKSRGIDGKQPIIDDMAPLFHARKDCSPILLVTGDRELEMLGRYEENAYFWRMLKVVGHEDCELLEMNGYNHGKMPDPAFPLLLNFIKQRTK